MNEHTLRYTSPAGCFNEALPIGNGSLGAMVYGGIRTERLSLNHDTLWSGKPTRFVREGAYEAYLEAMRRMDAGDPGGAEEALETGFVSPDTATYLPMVDMYLEYSSDAVITDAYRRSLDMRNGIAVTECAEHITKHLVSYKYRCLVTRVEFSRPSELSLKLSSQLKNRVFVEKEALILSGRCPSGMNRNGIYDYGNDGMGFSVIVRLETDGDAFFGDDRIAIKNAEYVTVYLSAETSYADHTRIDRNDHRERAYHNCSRCLEAGYASVYADHTEYFSEAYGRASVDISDGTDGRDTSSRLASCENVAGTVELLFNFGKYLTVSSSAPGSQATNLQGIWNEQLTPPWKSNYTVNINTEMNYWNTLPCGLTEFHEPIVGLVKKISDTGRTTAREYYHADGYVAHHNADLWGNTAAVGRYGEGKVFRGTTVYSYWCGASGWLCRSVFEHYEYTLDREYLSDTAYPLMKGAAEFYLSMLREVNGRLVISPSTSPENTYKFNGKACAIAHYTTMTQSIVADLFRNCIRSCEILHCDTEFAERLSKILPRVCIFDIDTTGRLMEWDKEYEECDKEHRHVSHLYGLYPGELVSTESESKIVDAFRRSLDVRGNDGTGWSLAWKACLWAKLKDGERAMKLIKRQLRLVPGDVLVCDLHNGGTYPNMLDAHPPFQIDGNFGITAAILMLFLQCENGKIKLLPALPRELDSGSVHGLRAKGCVSVDIAWKNGNAEYARLSSPIAQEVLVQLGERIDRVRLEADRAVEVRYR